MKSTKGKKAMKFSYRVQIYEVIPEEKNRIIETLTGIVEADAKNAVHGKAVPKVVARVEELSHQTGLMIAHGPIHVEYLPDSLEPLRFLSSLKHQICAVTKALDTRGTEVFGESLEAKSVKHEVMILLSELKIHGLIPEEYHER